MSKLRGAGSGRGPAPQDPELREFASRPLLTPVDPEFRDTLRSELWELLLALLARLRGR
jgi:hypothetical protein